VDDLPQIDSIYNKYYKDEFWLPNLDHTIGNGVISDGDNVVAFGMVRLYPEAIIVIDKYRAIRDKVSALKLLFDQAILSCKDRGYRELAAKTNDAHYANLLDKHFNFKPQDGKLMIALLEE
jgi:hypothetical protein